MAKQTKKAKAAKAKGPRVAWARLADWFRADVRNACEAIKAASIEPAQDLPGSPRYLAYRVLYWRAYLAETGTVTPVTTRDSVGDVAVDLADGGDVAYLSDAFARVVACYLAGKRSFPAVSGQPGVTGGK